MKLNILKALLLPLFLLISMSGCGTVKMLNIPEQKVQRDVPSHDINRAIEIALKKTKWKVTQNENSKITASLRGRKWSISIAITNTKETYDIKYLSSRNLKYNRAEQEIHPAYNAYIKKLKRQIDNEIKHVKITKKIVPIKIAENKKLETEGIIEKEEVEIW